MTSSRWSLKASALRKGVFVFCLVYLFVFTIGPLSGLLVAFEEFSYTKGIWSPFVGLQNITSLISDPIFLDLAVNTVRQGALRGILLFTLSYLVALLLAKLRSRGSQFVLWALLLAPQLLSWPATAILARAVFSSDGLLVALVPDLEGMRFFSSYPSFLLVFSYVTLWRESGPLVLILYIGLRSIDKGCLEAARVDGASALRRFLSILFPLTSAQRYLVVALLALSFIGGQFDPVYLLSNPALYAHTDTFDTYLYRVAITSGDFSRAMALELVKSAGVLFLLALSFPRLLLLLGKNQIAEQEDKLSPGFSSPVLFLLWGTLVVVLSLPWISLCAAFPLPVIDLLWDPIIVRSLYRSLVASVLGASASTALALLSGYSLYTLYWPGKNSQRTLKTVHIGLMGQSVLNGGLLGAFLLYRATGLLNTTPVLWLPYVLTPSLIVFVTFRLRSYPEDLRGAYLLETDDERPFFFSVFLKGDWPFTVSVWLQAFLLHWNNWIPGSFYILRSDLEPLQAKLRTLLLSDSGRLSLGYTSNTASLSYQLSSVILSIFPSLLGACGVLLYVLISHIRRNR